MCIFFKQAPNALKVYFTNNIFFTDKTIVSFFSYFTSILQGNGSPAGFSQSLVRGSFMFVLYSVVETVFGINLSCRILIIFYIKEKHFKLFISLWINLWTRLYSANCWLVLLFHCFLHAWINAGHIFLSVLGSIVC